MNDTELLCSLMSLFSEEDLLRLAKRAELVLPESLARHDLTQALTYELMRRDLEEQVKVPPLSDTTKYHTYNQGDE